MPKHSSTILFATNLSRDSTYALRYVVGLAKATGAGIRVLHVCEPLSEDARQTLTLFIQDPAARRHAVSQRLDDARRQLAERQENFWSNLPDDEHAVRAQLMSAEVMQGNTVEVILAQSQINDCTMIVLGAHQHGFSHTYLGQVAKAVLRRANVPTLIVPYRPGE